VTFSDFYIFFYCCYFYYYDKDETGGAADLNDAKLFCRLGGILCEFMN